MLSIKRYRLIIVLPIILFQYGCYSNVVRDYFQLSKVLSPENNFTFNETAFGRYHQFYDDHNFKIYFDFSRLDLGIYIRNKIDSTMEIIWDSSKVISNYDLLYYLIDYNPKGFINDYFNINWEDSSNKITCEISKRVQKPMIIDTTDGSVKLGGNIFYGFGFNNFKLYSDKYININWEFTTDKIIMIIENRSNATPIIKKDKGIFLLRRKKLYKICPLSLQNQLLSTTDKSKKSYFIPNSKILGKQTFYDDIITNAIDEDTPYYFSSPRSFFQFTKDNFECKSIQLELYLRQKNIVNKYVFIFNIEDYQVLRKG
ncbi:hypothetical protein MROS_0582 [Melioribacter roseus P3M-2]|uniref:Uncharacterized protein n=1 Tax=Melioribacter roseus (strain DSM 23840 / JCM 17771 / VKM B-2668 / P3M-2) TaxID=1191523 RepID=I6Z3V4_MELRP|nr:hypothetical protein MROS_0582 [Melioribacter roseus P3M-2]